MVSRNTSVCVTYRLIVPFYVKIFEFANLVLNNLYGKLVNPKVQFLLKRKEEMWTNPAQ